MKLEESLPPTGKVSRKELMKHYLKTRQPYFNDIKSKRKTFDLRLNDRNYQEGDTLILQEYILIGSGLYPTGQTLMKLVTYVLKDCPEFGLQEGYCILGIEDIINKDITLIWNTLDKIKTTGHQILNGWWYVYSPFDNDWHFVPDSDVSVCI